MIKKQTVHWIVSATAHYLSTLNYSLKSLHNLLPKDQFEFRVTIITNPDNEELERVKSNVGIILKNKETYNISEIEFIDCPPFPWPVLTLYKPFICQEYIRADDDFIFVGNCNLLIHENDFSWFDEEKINISWHHSHPEPFGNSKPYYVQGGFVFAKKELMRAFCETWQNRINFFIQYEHKIPDWHDETVLNELFNSEQFHELFKPTFKFFVDPLKRESEAFVQLCLNHVNNRFKGEKWCEN